MPFVSEGKKDFMTDRIQTIMSALKIKVASEKELVDRSHGNLSAQKFKKAEGFVVTHKVMKRTDSKTTIDKLVFLDQKGKVKAFGKVKYVKSAKAAQWAMFEELAMNSLPLELLIKRYAIDTKGLGDLCVIEKTYDKEKDKFIADESRVHFIRGNVVVSIRSVDIGVKVQDIAKTMNEALAVSTIYEK